MWPGDVPSFSGYSVQLTKKRSTALVSRSLFKGPDTSASPTALSQGKCRCRTVRSEVSGVCSSPVVREGPTSYSAVLVRGSRLARLDPTCAVSFSSRKMKFSSTGKPVQMMPCWLQRSQEGRARSHCSKCHQLPNLYGEGFVG